MKKETKSKRRERHKRYKNADLMKWSFQQQRANAKRRGKYWALTLEEFREFAVVTELMTKKGRKSLAYSVDRIKSEYGYYLGNIRRQEYGENSKKKILEYDWATRSARVIPYQELEPEHYPF